MPHRYFTTQITGSTAVLTEADARHCAVVMRTKPGARLTICDGHGTDYTCRVREAGPDRVVLDVISSCPSVSEPSVRVILYVGYPKQDKLEDVIQKAVELGAAEIVPFFSRFCVAAPKKEEQKNLRYNRIAFEAAKQSGRGVVPHVAMPLPYARMLQQARACDAALFCYEAHGEPLLSRLAGARTIAIITGSEGGFAPEEAQAAAEAGCACIRLGPRILRCETAPIAALSVVMALTGNLQ